MNCDESYLVTMFLKSMAGNHSDDSAIEAARICEAEYDSRDVSKQELIDFWDSARDYPILKTLNLDLITAAEKVYPHWENK